MSILPQRLKATISDDGSVKGKVGITSLHSQVKCDPDLKVRAVGIQGPQGPPGIVWKGVYSGTETYNTGDIVFYNGSSFIAVSTNILGLNPQDNPDLWDYMAQSGDGTTISYIRETPMTITVGGATAGTTFNGSVVDALDTILYPYATPSFSSFALSGYSVLEVGNSIPAGNITFTWSTAQSSNIQPDTITIQNTTDSVTYVTNSTNDGTETIALSNPLVINTQGSKTFRVSAINTQNSTLSRDYSVSWYWRIYYGESTDTSLDTEVEVEALRSNLLASSASRTYSFIEGGYKWLAYPTSMGLKTTFQDADTGFPVAMEVPITVSLTNMYGVTQNYYVHRTYNVLGGSIRISVS